MLHVTIAGLLKVLMSERAEGRGQRAESLLQM